MKQEDYKRQLVIANSLYEMGVDINLIKQITTVKKVDLENKILEINYMKGLLNED